MESHVPVSIDNAKCVLVIGATSGLGRALALAISELPGRPTVIAAGRRQDRLKELEAKKLETLQIDVAADPATLETTVDSLVAKYPDVKNLYCIFLFSLNPHAARCGCPRFWHPVPTRFQEGRRSQSYGTFIG